MSKDWTTYNAPGSVQYVIFQVIYVFLSLFHYQQRHTHSNERTRDEKKANKMLG